MRFQEMLKSKGYEDAMLRIESWERQLSYAKGKELVKIRDSMALFFSQMQESDPQMYGILRINHKRLGEIVHEKMTASRVILD
jgi:hypothetical protein